MKVLDPTSSLQSFDDALVFSESACLARPLTEGLAVELTARSKEIDELEANKKLNRRNLRRAQARAVVADGDIDALIKKMQSAALALTEQNRNVAWFVTLFFATLAELTRPALTKQIGIAEELIERLSDAGVPVTLRETFEPLLKGAVARGREIDAARKELRRQRRNLRIEESELKTKINQTRTQTYGKLLNVSGSKAEAEKYFPSPQRIEADEEESDAGDASAETPE
ncbi:MAG: hypothetical protein HY791_17165 [Deltaproteobacteria bacterium]|nr:hypothetical protein [Deltaproteobacteria bacterium]